MGDNLDNIKGGEPAAQKNVIQGKNTFRGPVIQMRDAGTVTITNSTSALGRLSSRWVAAVDARVRRVFSRYPRHYRRHLVEVHRHVSVTKGVSAPACGVYVDLRLREVPFGDIQQGVFRAPDDGGEEHWSPTRLAAVLAGAGAVRVVVTGPRGGGKSGLLSGVVMALTSERRHRNRVPLYFTFDERVVSEIVGDAGVSLAGILRTSVEGLPVPVPPRWFESRLVSNCGLVIADGLEHVSPRYVPEVNAWFAKQLTLYPGLSVLISHAPESASPPLPGAFTALAVSELDPGQVDSLIKRWGRAVGADDAAFAAELRGALREQPGLWACAGNPAALNSIFGSVWARWRTGRELRAGEIWEALVTGPLGSDAETLEDLGRVAAAATARHTFRIAFTEIVKSPDASSERESMLLRSGLVRRCGYDRAAGPLAFAFSALQDYFAARHLHLARVDDADLRRWAADPWWRHPLLHYADLAEDNALRVLSACLEATDPVSVALGITVAAADGVMHDEAARDCIERFELHLSDLDEPVLRRARLLANLDQAMSLDGCRQVVGHALTGGEYELFVADAGREGQRKHLDHWRDGRLSGDQAELPASGIRSSDLDDLSAWVSELYAGRFRFRLPRPGEIPEARAAWREDDSLLLWWKAEHGAGADIPARTQLGEHLRRQLERDVFQRLPPRMRKLIDAQTWRRLSETTPEPALWRVEPRSHHDLDLDVPPERLTALAVALAAHRDADLSQQARTALRVAEPALAAATATCRQVIGCPLDVHTLDLDAGMKLSDHVHRITAQIERAYPWQGSELTGEPPHTGALARLNWLALAARAAMGAVMDRERHARIGWPTVRALRWCARLTMLVLVSEVNALTSDSTLVEEINRWSRRSESPFEDTSELTDVLGTLIDLGTRLYVGLALTEIREHSGDPTGLSVSLIRESEPDVEGAA